MNLSLKKREIIMVAVLGLLLYGFAFVKFILIPVIPQIAEKKQQIESLENQKKALDADMANIEAKKADIRVKELTNQRTEEYLMNSASITDSVEYIEKLSALLGKSIGSININKPVEFAVAIPAAANSAPPENNVQANSKPPAPNNSPTGKFYEFKIDFETIMTYDEVNHLVQYCEGSTRKTRIAKLEIHPILNADVKQLETVVQAIKTIIDTKIKTAMAPSASAKTTANPAPTNTAPVVPVPEQKQAEKFKINMSICFYSQNPGNMDKIYDFSRGKFQKYIEKDEKPFDIPKKDKDGNAVIPDIASAKRMNLPENPEAIKLASSDLYIKELGFLVGGDNFSLTSGTDPSQRVKITTKDRIDIHLRLNNSSYSVETVEENGRRSNMSGFLKDRDFLLTVDMAIPFVKENENLGLDIKISNDSDKNINVKLTDGTSKVKFYDRNGKAIIGKSRQEKLYFV